jgi:hypothetical protein
MTTHVKLINRGTGMPQVMLKKVWDNINQNNPKLALKLEYMNDCDEAGNAPLQEEQQSEEPETEKTPELETPKTEKQNGELSEEEQQSEERGGNDIADESDNGSHKVEFEEEKYDRNKSKSKDKKGDAARK